MRRPVILAVLAAAFCSGAVAGRPLLAQQVVPTRVGVAPATAYATAGWGCSGSLAGACAPGSRVSGKRDATERRRWAPVASLMLPGMGQVVLQQDRFVAYLALEAWAVLEFANQRTEARRQQARYRGLARDVARSLYGLTPPVGSWAYYESMEHYVESGVFDRIPGGEVDPDIDIATYNGAMWLLARQTFWTDPTVPPLSTTASYRYAMNFYLDRAVRSEYRWSWRNAQLEQDLYVRTIRRSNTSFREARRALGLVIANHLLSSVDAFVTLRVEGLGGGDATRGFALRGSLPLP